MTKAKRQSRGPGQPTKLTPTVQAKVCTAIRKGNYAVVAAGAAGIGERTLYTWIERGEQDGEGIYFEFLQAVRQAECDCEIATIEAWQQEGAGSWQARAEFLARRFRERWAKQENLKVDATVKVTGARESLLAKLERMAGADAVDPELKADDASELEAGSSLGD